MIISIDPGLNHVAVALWSDRGTLLHASLVRNPDTRNKKLPRPERWAIMASAVVRKISSMPTVAYDPHQSLGLVVEIPKVRQRGSGKGDPNDLIDVAGVAAAIVAAFKATAGAFVAWAPLPEEWKGQLPKEVSLARVQEKLTSAEKATVEDPPPGLYHNVIDAIHLGIVHFKR